jgi:hypothetical protein
MNNYIIAFIERNATKSFVSNLRKYVDLDVNGKKKVISSFLTHLFIDAENGIDNVDQQKELVAILNEFIYYGIDNFLEWLEENVVEENDG